MKFLLSLVCVALVTLHAAAEIRQKSVKGRIYTGSHCEYIKLCSITSVSGCSDGYKFVIKQNSGVRKQFLIMDGTAILAFVQNGVKFTACTSYTEVTLSVDCKEVAGLSDVDLSATEAPAAGTRQCQCGQRGGGRVIGGQDAQAGSHPWIAAIARGHSGNNFYCGGSLVASEWVVTAAHCLHGENPAGLSVVLGEHHRKQQDETPLREVIGMAHVIIHANFDIDTFDNDIALIRLARPASLLAHTPVCLPGPGHFKDGPGKPVWVAGWGKVKETGDRGAVVLQELQLTTVTNQECKDGFQKAGFDYEVSERMVCAGGEKGRDGCQGDSGGPLVGLTGDGAATLTGITSWGEGCGREGIYGVYTRVSSLVSWLQSNMAANGGATFC